MKKRCIAVCLIIVLAACLCGCANRRNAAKSPASSAELLALAPETGPTNSETPQRTEEIKNDEVIDITEKMYVSWINEIYTNTEEYLGRTIKIEGMFTSQYYEGTDTTYYYVYRVGPGCCGNDGSMCGFEFTYDGKMPKKNDWVEVIGTLDTYEEEGNTYLTLRSTSVTVKKERGKETVSQ